MNKILKLVSLVILLCLALTVLASCSANAVGKYSLRWIDTSYGTIYDTPDLCIELKSNGTFTYGTEEGKWSMKGDEITLTYDTGDTASLNYDDGFLKQSFYEYSIGHYEYTFGKDE